MIVSMFLHQDLHLLPTEGEGAHRQHVLGGSSPLSVCTNSSGNVGEPQKFVVKKGQRVTPPLLKNPDSPLFH
jgi:hypothetical protein